MKIDIILRDCDKCDVEKIMKFLISSLPADVESPIGVVSNVVEPTENDPDYNPFG
jgi:hypothetical protein